MTRIRISLVTLGDPHKQTGGYLYHRRLAGAAPRHDAEVRFVSFPDRPFPLPAVLGRDVMRAAAADADVVVVDSIATAFAAPWLGHVKVPLVGMLHQGPGGIDHGVMRTRFQEVLDRRAYRSMHALMVASQSLRDDLQGCHDDIRVVAPGRDPGATVDVAVIDLRRGRDVAFLCVGNWIPRKGIVELLDAFARIDPSTGTLHLVGDHRADEGYARKVWQRVERLADRVIVYGTVAPADVSAFYRDADIFVMPSSREPYGTVYGEAMAAGLPVVGWRAGNLPYLARDQREGLIIERGDIGALAAAMTRLAGDADLRMRMGQAARVRGESFPTWEETAATFFSSVRDIVEGGVK